MNGLKTNLSEERQKVLKATAMPPKNGDYVGDGQDEDDRPLTKQEMRAGIKGGRPRSTNPKKSTTIRLNAEVLEYFKAQGKGWQTKINDVLQEYVDSVQ
ncbi:MAG: BrnA antitoxin family protein [Thermodesulfobacteriota bacterium]